ncbi:MAG TPA: extensin family protein [Xanthobacteraceae bacterium]|nr:extensin family protein [Xanthobacteraceae bacterium]
MTRGVQWSLVCFVVFVALLALAGCSHYLFAEREPWRHDAEIACLNSGAVKDTPQRVRISSISGPGICGMDYPIRIAALGDNPPLAYDAEPPRPPSAIPSGAVPREMSQDLPPVQSTGPQYDPYADAGYSAPSRRAVIAPGQANQPLSLYPPGLAPPDEDDEEIGIPGGVPHPYYGGPQAPYAPGAQRNSGAIAPPQQPPSSPPLGPSRGPLVTGSAGPVEVSPPATLACPIVAALDGWIATSVQPAALRWFRQPVVEIKQISAYSCRGMNGNPNAHISEHAFGNALDIAEFDLADGHVVTVQYGWRGTPEEQGFLHDVQSAACDQFSTVLAPGANVYHYNHIHVDLMRRASGRRICEPGAISGEVAAARAGGRFAAQRYGDRYGDPGVTGTIKDKTHSRPLGYSREDDDRLPSAVAGDD